MVSLLSKASWTWMNYYQRCRRCLIIDKANWRYKNNLKKSIEIWKSLVYIIMRKLFLLIVFRKMNKKYWNISLKIIQYNWVQVRLHLEFKFNLLTVFENNNLEEKSHSERGFYKRKNRRIHELEYVNNICWEKEASKELNIL